MSIRCQTWVYEHSEATGNERLVLLAIADEADDDGTNGHPGIDRIAHKARVNKRTTMRCIDRLEAAGRLVVHRPEVKGRGHFNTYVVVMAEGVKGGTLAPAPPEKGREKARNGAQPYLAGTRPTDPLTPSATETPTRADPLAGFEQFWSTYPRKVAKGTARTAWPAAVKAAGGPEPILAGVARFAADPNLPRGADEQQFIPHPSTWLRSERWGDPPLPQRNGRGPRPGPSRLSPANNAAMTDPTAYDPEAF